MKEADDSKWLLKNKRDEALAAEGLAKRIVKVRSGCLGSVAVLYKNNVLAALRRQKTMSLSQNAFLSSQPALKYVEHPVAVPLGQDT